MKIFSAKQIKNWDSFTIKNEPIASVDLMERAAKACADWILKKFQQPTSFKIVCGKGNNGGDGLAIARLLIQNNFPVCVYIAESPSAGSGDFNINLLRLKEISSAIYFLESTESFPAINKDDVIIDALFGTGLNKKPSGIFKKLIVHLNNSGAQIISIDIPSGLYADVHSDGNAIIQARYTLSFQQQKVAFLLAENESFCGEVAILDIGLSQEYYNNEQTPFELIDKNTIEEIYVPRKPFANKGNYGYACLVVGSYGMMGAAVLSARSCLRSGVGKLTCYICKEGYTIMQTAVPEAMCAMFGTTFIKDIDNLKNFDVIGIGPGIGRHLSHKQLLQKVFKNSKGPAVLDADGLNILSSYPALYKSIPQHSILTPHPKEFDRLFGKSENDFERMELALKKAKELSVYIVLKGHHTLIATPEGKGFFNSTGNAGMATAGSGDVLTGIFTGLLAQKYTSLEACILGVYLHGLAGDIAAKKLSKEAMIAGDIIDYLGDAFIQISH
ncbi:NAD(P)H-hydrate dehydratase [Ginsengibacter hankyongi]|uniref:Bifunctional NAD(P)H-hydrate repair enzyme n=1 Tax=Ginsengibacter hankyongi TaxID=2607284 RepID=A0A5J5I9I6_9BACT|nr:NAD(P)H-hydrate dehydratase [Ginsengibacter hankyongi]KAA9034347.1 NAD(P)H-hydrate dehydratase [Ginsengibacter hankyongi]